MFDRRSSPAPAPFRLPWKNNRIFPTVVPEEKGGVTENPKAIKMQQLNSVDNGMVIDGNYFQTKEGIPSAKTRLGKVLSEMNIFKTLKTQKNPLSSISGTLDHRSNGSIPTSWSLSESKRKSQRIPSEDIIQQSYTGSAMSVTPYHPYRLQEGAQMSSLDSDDDQDQSPLDSDRECQTKNQLDDTEIESKTESDSDQETETEKETETEQESDTERASETENESSSEEDSSRKESVKSKDRGTVSSVRSSWPRHSSTTSQRSVNSTYERKSSVSSSEPATASTHMRTLEETILKEDEDDKEDRGQMEEGRSKDPRSSVSKSSNSLERHNSNVHSMSRFSVMSTSVAKALEIDKLSPIDENDEGEMTGGSPGESSSSSDGARTLKVDGEDEESNADTTETDRTSWIVFWYVQ